MSRLVFPLLLGFVLAVVGQTLADVVLVDDPTGTYRVSYTYPSAIVGTGGGSLGEVVIKIANISGDGDNDPTAFQGSVTGQLHQDTSVGVGDTPTYADLGFPAGAEIDTHFALDAADVAALVAVAVPAEDVDVGTSPEPPQQGGATSFGSSLSGTFMISQADPDPVWELLHVVAPLGTDLDLDFQVTGYAGNIVSFAETLAVGILGDVNLDGIVNSSDFTIMADNWQDPGDWSSGNINYDGIVNSGDFTVMADHWQESVVDVPPAPAAVALIPEPGSLIMLATGLLGLLFYLRRRDKA